MSTHSIRYSIIPARPEAHIYRINCIIPTPEPQGQLISLPAWIPGSYMIRDFAKNVVWLKAWRGKQEIAVEKRDKQTWQLEAGEGEVRVEYEVYAWDLSVRTAHLDQTHAYFNGTSVFVKVHGQDHLPCGLEIQPPSGDAYRDWRVATSLACDSAALYGFGTYQAEDYDELIDHPVELGTFTLASFEACGVQHDIAITGKHDADMDRLCRDLKVICEHHIRFFGEPAPMQRYVFQLMVVGEGYGGLEHRASTSLLCSRYDLPQAGVEKITEQYRTLLALCSHEYFHTWNVKRIKPAVFLPYSLDAETHTPLMWVFEGFTSYYDELSLVKCGLIDNDTFLEMLGQTITRVLSGSGRLRQSVADSSFDTWTKFYKQDENAPNAIVNYYTKGALIGLMLDLMIRQRSEGTFSLDDVMRKLWADYGQTCTGIEDDTVSRIIEDITGFSLESEIREMVYGTDDLPLTTQLSAFAISMKLRAAASSTDKGGKADKDVTDTLSLGARYTAFEGGVRLSVVLDEGAAQQAGLSAGDVIVAVDNIKVSAENFHARLQRMAGKKRVKVAAFRRDELMQFELPLIEGPKTTCYLEQEEQDAAAVKRRSHWLENSND